MAQSILNQLNCLLILQALFSKVYPKNCIEKYYIVLPLQRGDRLLSESDVCRRQILTTKVDSCTVRVEIFLKAVEP